MVLITVKNFLLRYQKIQNVKNESNNCNYLRREKLIIYFVNQFEILSTLTISFFCYPFASRIINQ